MKFIRVSDTLCIRKDEIIAVESTGEYASVIFTEAGTFSAAVPYTFIVDLIENDKTSDSAMLKEISWKVGNLPVFAG